MVFLKSILATVAFLGFFYFIYQIMISPYGYFFFGGFVVAALIILVFLFFYILFDSTDIKKGGDAL